jgi:hypothetical protein
VLCSVSYAGSYSLVYGLPERKGVIKTGLCKVTIADVLGPFKFCHTHYMFSTLGLVLFATIQKHLVAAIRHHPTEIDDLGGVGTRQVFNSGVGVR